MSPARLGTPGLRVRRSVADPWRRLRLQPSHASWVILAVGMILALPTLAVGFFADDYAFLVELKRLLPNGPPWWDLYRFTATTDDGNRALIASGMLPWWTAPALRFHFVRPLASALLGLDYWLFGDAPLGGHLHSLLWWFALLFVLRALYRRLLPGATGALALLVFAIAPAHVYAYGWASARHTLVAALPAVLGLLAHVRARREGWAPGRWLGPLALAGALLGSEAGLGGVAFWIAYELVGPPELGGARQRLLGGLPAGALGSAYLVAYALVGGGTAASAGYVSPFSSPVPFLRAAQVRFPTLLANALLGIPAELSIGSPTAPFVAAGIAGVVGVALLFWAIRAEMPTHERAAVRWLALGAVMATAPAAGGFPGGRALLLADVGFAAVLATTLRHAFGRDGVALALRRAAAGLLAAVHGVAAPFMVVGLTATTVIMARRTEAVAHAVATDAASARRVFIVAASDPMVTMYAGAALKSEGGYGLSCWSWLSGTRADHKMTRLDATTLRLEPVGTAMLKGPFESLYRAPSLPMHAGDEVSQCGARVRVTAVEAGRPTGIEVQFDTPLDDPGVALVAWDGERLARVRAPELGQTAVLPWRPGPMRMF
jgi:hypothetical protein